MSLEERTRKSTLCGTGGTGPRSMQTVRGKWSHTQTMEVLLSGRAKVFLANEATGRDYL